MSTGSNSRLSRGNYIDWWRHRIRNSTWNRFTRENIYWHLRTFMMCNNPLWDFKFAPWWKVTWSRFEEKEWFLWDGVAQFLGVRSVVSSNGNDLRNYKFVCLFLFYDECRRTFFPFRMKEAILESCPNQQRNWMFTMARKSSRVQRTVSHGHTWSVASTRQAYFQHNTLSTGKRTTFQGSENHRRKTTLLQLPGDLRCYRFGFKLLCNTLPA